ncbi:hypothetical protein NONI108955_44435 [Nocardia ninae]|uniref:Uncharacterized protein n=1 Tax=Nocardia ninae NBRC 108245 TaxID=1210091 RepID=A0A511MJS2_9NOCA|nr:hypothetical protein NN4_53930 [Nocardia ninae NBRC 108245]
MKSVTITWEETVYRETTVNVPDDFELEAAYAKNISDRVSDLDDDDITDDSPDRESFAIIEEGPYNPLLPVLYRTNSVSRG